MAIALTRDVTPAMDRCLLTFREREAIDFARAVAQQSAYRALLAKCGLTVVALPGSEDLPDGAFVEDTAVVLDEVAVLARMGAEPRRAESGAIADALSAHRRVLRMEPPATLDGGDVLLVGRRLFIGLTARTNPAGIEQLRALVAPHGYEVVPVSVHGCLHLKTAVTALDEQTVLAQPAWADLAGLRVLPVPEQEPWAADVLRLGRRIVLHCGFPRTAAFIAQQGFEVETVDVSEFLKAEAGVTCLSLVFSTRSARP